MPKHQVTITAFWEGKINLKKEELDVPWSASEAVLLELNSQVSSKFCKMLFTAKVGRIVSLGSW